MSPPAGATPSTGGRKLSARGEARRRQILECGVRLVAERGVLAVKVIDIARTLGIPSSLFYWYFRDFDDLLTQAVTDCRRYMRHVIAERIVPVDDYLAKVYIASYLPVRLAQYNEIERVATVGDIEVSLHPRYASEVRRSVEGYISEMAVLLAEGRDQGTIRSDVEMRHLALTIHSSVHQNVVLYYRGFESGDLTRLAETVASMAVRGVCSNLDHALTVEQTWATQLRPTPSTATLRFGRTAEPLQSPRPRPALPA